MTKAIAGLFCLVFLSGISSAFAEPVETVKTEYYEVHGATLKEVRQSINKHSSTTHNFGSHDALTESRIDTKWGTPPVVTLVITFKMPKWVESSSAPKAVQEKWQAYIKSVQFHEDGHAKIARECARAVEQREIAEGPKPGRNLNHDINNIYTDYDKKQLAYDKETKHGQLQNPVILE